VKRFVSFVVVFALWLACVSIAQAGLVFIPNTYGMSARSIGLGNAMTAVGNDYSVAYFNPAALGAMTTSQLDIGYLYAAPRFNGGLNDGGDEINFETDNKLVLLGFTMNLSELFNNKHGLGLGFDMSIDNNLKSFMNFEDSRDDNGQFARYGLSSVTMVTGLGIKIIPQLYVGGGGFIMIKGENKLIAETDMAGNTREEEIQVSAEPAFAPIISLYAPVHPVITIGASYRGKALAKFDAIDATTDALVSDSRLTTLNLLMAFKDTYVPQQATLGVAVRPMQELLLSVDGTWANWGDYDEEVSKKDAVKENADFDTHDIYIPRFGIEWTALENVCFRAGYYYEDTPFSDPGIGNAVVLDNAKHVFSLGAAHDITYIPFLAHPLTVGATYFNHYLISRTVEAGDGRKFESSGDLNGVIGTLTLRY